MPFFVVFYGEAVNHPLHPPYHEPGIGTSDHKWVAAPPLGIPPLDGSAYTGFTVSGAQFASWQAADTAVETANAQSERPVPYTIVEAPDEPTVIERVSLRRWLRVLSTRDVAFLGPATAELHRDGELLLSYAHPYDNNYIRDWFLVHDEEELQRVLARGRRLFWFEAFLNPRLPLRGVVDEQFERRVLDLLQEACYAPRTLPDGTVRMEQNDCLLTATIQPGRIELDTAHLDEPEDVTTWMRAHWGQYIAVGPTPAEWAPSLRPPGTYQSAVAVTPDEYGHARSGAMAPSHERVEHRL